MLSHIFQETLPNFGDVGIFHFQIYFFTKYPSLIYIDGSDSFKGEKTETYRLSKYDGHPNEKAHEKMATEVFEIIKNTNQIYNAK